MAQNDQIYDTAGRILEAAEYNMELASNSINAMKDAITKLECSSDELGRQILQD